jgi:hypothetical protein
MTSFALNDSKFCRLDQKATPSRNLKIYQFNKFMVLTGTKKKGPCIFSGNITKSCASTAESDSLVARISPTPIVTVAHTIAIKNIALTGTGYIIRASSVPPNGVA